MNLYPIPSDVYSYSILVKGTYLNNKNTPIPAGRPSETQATTCRLATNKYSTACRLARPYSSEDAKPNTIKDKQQHYHNQIRSKIDNCPTNNRIRSKIDSCPTNNRIRSKINGCLIYLEIQFTIILTMSINNEEHRNTQIPRLKVSLGYKHTQLHSMGAQLELKDRGNCAL